MIFDVISLFLCFLTVGIVAGLLAGLFGIGGGMVVVPAMWYLSPWLGLNESIQMPLIYGTSFGCIAVTTFSSTRSHYQLGNISWQAARFLVPSLMITAILASTFITKIDRHVIVKIFAILLIFLAIRMLRKSKFHTQMKVITPTNTSIAGILIGLASSVGGIGGGGFVVPFLTSRGISIKPAIGTAALCSFGLGLASAIGYAVQGFGNPQLPLHSFGFIYLPALFGITIASFFTARLGAKLVNRLPVTTIKKAFAVFLILVAMNMFFK